jgi:hypothetical protein
MNACRDAKFWPASGCISFWVHHDISTLKDRANKASSDLDLNIIIIFLEVESKEEIWNSSANPQTSNGTSLSLSLSLSLNPPKLIFFLNDFLCSQAKDRKKIQLLKLFAYVESLVESLILWWELNYISSTSILYYMNAYRIN